MSDARGYDDQGLPWLEGVEDEDGPRVLSSGKMLTALGIVLLAVALIAGGFFLIGRRDTVVSGAPELIKADPAPYKIKPTDPGGLDVAGDSETAFATSAGEDTDAALAGHPAPVPAPAANEMVAEKPKPEPKPEPKPKPEPEPATPEAAPVAAGPTIQLGAYNSTIKAETAWGMLSSRFPSVAGLSKQVVAASVGGKTIYRLRAGGSSDATRAACAALKAAGESCLAVN